NEGRVSILLTSLIHYTWGNLQNNILCIIQSHLTDGIESVKNHIHSPSRACRKPIPVDIEFHLKFPIFVMNVLNFTLITLNMWILDQLIGDENLMNRSGDGCREFGIAVVQEEVGT